jgi:hypothetical protein
MIYSREMRLSSWSNVNMSNAVMRDIVVPPGSRATFSQRWTEFFVTMFPTHQGQHVRRPVQTAEGGCRE